MYTVGECIAMVKAVYIFVNDKSTVTCVTVLKTVIPTICTVVHANRN